jgi:hypothetical protein
MNHGVIGYFDHALAAVWEAAVAAGEWPAVFAPRTLELPDDWRRQRARDLGEAARWAFVRPVVLEGTHYEYARYEPEAEDVFVRMIGSRLPWLIAAAPSAAPDAPVLDLMRLAGTTGPDLVERSVRGKRFRPALQSLAIPTRWVLLNGCTGEDPVTLFLSEDAQTADRVRDSYTARAGTPPREAW